MTTESDFSRWLVAGLRKKGWFVQRIESGTTGSGIPDVYCISPEGRHIWLELKRVHRSGQHNGSIRVPWHDGQQAWMYQVTRYPNTSCLTLIRFDDLIGVVDMHQGPFEERLVPRDKWTQVPPRIDALVTELST